MDTRKISDTIIDGLKNAAVELEEFQLQCALGKADATEKYEEIKKSLNATVHDINMKMDKGSDKVDNLKDKFEGLKLQLALGKADTEDAVREQKVNVQKAIGDLEYSLKNNKVVSEYVPVLQQELEKFKIKSEMLFEKHDIEGKKESFLKTIEGFKNKFQKETSSIEHFSDEIGEAFSHFKKAFKK